MVTDFFDSKFYIGGCVAVTCGLFAKYLISSNEINIKHIPGVAIASSIMGMAWPALLFGSTYNEIYNFIYKTNYTFKLSLINGNEDEDDNE